MCSSCLITMEALECVSCGFVSLNVSPLPGSTELINLQTTSEKCLDFQSTLGSPSVGSTCHLSFPLESCHFPLLPTSQLSTIMSMNIPGGELLLAGFSPCLP